MDIYLEAITTRVYIYTTEVFICTYLFGFYTNGFYRAHSYVWKHFENAISLICISTILVLSISTNSKTPDYKSLWHKYSRWNIYEFQQYNSVFLCLGRFQPVAVLEMDSRVSLVVTNIKKKECVLA